MPRKSKAVMAKVDRVTEVCNVTSEEAHRVLADCEMDVQRAIERFVSGEEDWSEVAAKKKKACSTAAHPHFRRPLPPQGA